MVVQYEYRVALKDSHYFHALVERDIAPTLGITEYPDRFKIFFGKRLTAEQKSRLDELVRVNPTPVAVYELSPLTPEDVERGIGIKPVWLKYDPTTNQARIYFDKTLTPDQERKLEVLLHAPMKFRKRKAGVG